MLKEKSRGRQLKKNDSCTCLGWIRPNTCLEWRSDLHRLAGKENNRCSSWMCASKCSSFLSLPFERSLDFQAVKRVYISTRYLAPASQGVHAKKLLIVREIWPSRERSLIYLLLRYDALRAAEPMTPALCASFCSRPPSVSPDHTFAKGVFSTTNYTDVAFSRKDHCVLLFINFTNGIPKMISSLHV